MTDYKGYDLTGITEHAAREIHDSAFAHTSITEEKQAEIDADPESLYRPFDELSLANRNRAKESLLPFLTAVLNGIEATGGKREYPPHTDPTLPGVLRDFRAHSIDPPGNPTPMYEYTYNSAVHQMDPGSYENIPHMHDLATCTVWTLHLHVAPEHKQAVLDRMALLPFVTGEYIYGDSWTEWGEETDDDADRHLAIYFRAESAVANKTGFHLANHATLAALRADRETDLTEAKLEYAISTSGDYAVQFSDYPSSSL